MNDSDFEMLARDGGGAFDAWLRSAAVGHSIAFIGTRNQPSLFHSKDAISIAKEFYDYIKGNASENLPRQDQR